MTAQLLMGAPVAAALTDRTKQLVMRLGSRCLSPTLAIVRVGAKPSDVSYERGARARAVKTGIDVRLETLPEDATDAQLLRTVGALSDDSAVNGILLLRPLPAALDEKAVCAAIDPRKDVDGVTPQSMALVYSGTGLGFPPCTAQAVMELLEYYHIPTAGKRAAVIGRSLVTGKPAAMLLTAADATSVICHSKTQELADITRRADIVVAATGRAEFLDAGYFRAGQTVIDVGVSYSQEKNKLVGDVNFQSVSQVVSAITPVPGGVGAVTSALLCLHTALAAGGMK